MAKDSNIRSGGAGGRTRAGAARSRTDELVREIDESAAGEGWSRLLSSRNFLLSAMVWAGFVLIVGVAVVMTREAPNAANGRVMTSARIARAEFVIEDDLLTQARRAAARSAVSRVCVPAANVLEEVRTSLDNLPLAVQAAAEVGELESDVRQQFAMTPQALTALHGQMIEGKIAPAWTDRVRRLHGELLRTPVLSDEDFAVLSQDVKRLELRPAPVAPVPPGTGTQEEQAQPAPPAALPLEIPMTSALQVGSPRLAQDLRARVVAAGFSGPLIDVALARLLTPLQPTYAHDGAATAKRQEEAAAGIAPARLTFHPGEVIYRRGVALTGADLDKVRALTEAERRAETWWRVAVQRGAIFALVGAVTAALAGYAALFVPRLRRKPLRSLAVAGLMAGATVIGCWATVAAPGLIALTGTAPTVFVTILLVVAYQQRVALAFGALHGVLMCIALDQPIGLYAVIVVGIGVAVWQLREVRDRNALTRTGLAEAAALAIGTFVVSLVELPPTGVVVRQAAMDALLAGGGGFAVCLLALGLLPILERTLGLVTGMKLVELRDPKEPLLRQLQQRAPGTYNHSLTIASLGEAAAEAIGADGLLTYVGALYHDIGKMNKPDYFVENQAPGFNRHDRLSPTMSLLVIVGHVKDGMELAREFNLPRALQHFIESHHGTTLVEYFYHRAKRQAEAAAMREGEESEEAEVPAEIEYRYPGPKPRTKEAAIVMLCDAVESASRTMADPTPARVDQLVRGIASKRLGDGQFDECDLTLRELNAIVETVSKTLSSIYHGRIAYPSGAAGIGAIVPGTSPGNGTPSTKDRISAAAS